VTVRHRLSTFTTKETSEYIKHRLNVAGGGLPKVEFDAAAAKIIHNASGGIPRLIGTLCDYALLIAFTQEKRVITAKIAKEAVRKHSRKEQVCKLPPSTSGAGVFWKNWMPAGLSAVCLIVTLALTARNGFGPEWNAPTTQIAQATETVGSDPAWETTIGSDDENTPEWLQQDVDIEGPSGDRDDILEASAPQDLEPIDASTVIWGTEAGSEGEVEVVLDTAEPGEPPKGLSKEKTTVEEVTGAIEGEDLLDLTPPKPAPDRRKQTPVVVPPPPPPPTAVPAEPKRVEMKVGLPGPGNHTAPLDEATLNDEPDPSRRYGVQVASLRTNDRARQLADQLKQFGPVFLVPWTASDNQPWVRVVLGVFEDREDGNEMIHKLNAANLGRDIKIVENRWWQQMPGASGGDVLTLAEE
jgi:cell division septation protein DedD